MTVQSKVTLQETQLAMEELVVVGKRPNGKLAYWSAALSKRNRLDRNCIQSLVMRQYVDRPLPINRDELKAQLGPCLKSTINTLYQIEKLWNSGIIHFNCGTTFEEQDTWRASMVAAIPGMGYKTVSFALHIYAPFQCQLLTIDCWHLARIQAPTKSPKPAQYLAYEQEIFAEISIMASCEGQGYAPIVYAACLWERTRQASEHHQRFSKVDGYQDHSGLSCYL